MPKAWSAKRERQYEEIRKSELDQGRSEARAVEEGRRSADPRYGRPVLVAGRGGGSGATPPPSAGSKGARRGTLEPCVARACSSLFRL